MTIPKPIPETLGLGANAPIPLEIDARRLIVEPRVRPKYTLAELVAACHETAEPDREAREWDAALPVGRETM